MQERPVRLAGVVLTILLALPLGAIAEGPCTCDDIKRLELELEHTRKKLAAWEKVASEAAKKTFPTAAWAKDRYLELWKEAFPGSVPVVAGQQKPGQEAIYVSPEFKENNCDAIWKAVEAHERDHQRFDTTVPGYKAGWVIVLGQEGAQIARKEVEGHKVQVHDLEIELANLKKTCRVVVQRYQEQRKADRAVALARLMKAGARVRAYASTIR